MSGELARSPRLLFQQIDDAPPRRVSERGERPIDLRGLGHQAFFPFVASR